MATAEEVLDKDLRKFCANFGFNFEAFKSTIITVPKEVSIMFGIISTDTFYDQQLSQWGPINVDDKNLFNNLHGWASNILSKISGGSGKLNWGERHEIFLTILFQMDDEESRTILLYLEPTVEVIKTIRSAWQPYLNTYYKTLRFIAFIKAVYPEWMTVVQQCKVYAMRFKELEQYKSHKIFPWYWQGELNSADHAAIIHESIHSILENNNLNRIIDSDAYREGVDVFLHRRSGLFLGYYKIGFGFSIKNIFSKSKNANLKEYWNASELFWIIFNDVKDPKQIIIILRNPTHPKMIKLKELLDKAYRGRSFHD